MTQPNPQPQKQDTATPHGDKLSGATGGRPRPAESPVVAPAEPPLKAHGDKLKDAVDKARS